MKTLNQTPEHPTNEELAAFALGKEVPNAETIAEHVANCARCETLIAKTPRDTFLGILNKARPGASLTGPYAPKTDPSTADELPPELRQQTKYTFLKKLGGGGMGVVYLAEHNLMKRKVAVKLIPPEMIGNPAVRERFLQEVVSAAALEHPNVVRAYSAEEFGEHMLFEMEFVDGSDLGAVVKNKGPLPLNFAVNYIRQAAQGLQHGMLKSLVHRDIKPGNLMLTRAGSVKVADFGLAKFSRESDKGPDRSLTGANVIMGTPDFMSPEQARNAKRADIRADIYSLGCTFYYLLTGQPPFAGKSITDLIFKHWEDARPDVGAVRDDVPAELAQFIQRMMAKEPNDRPQTPKEVVDWLAKFTKGEPTKKESVVAVRKEANDEMKFQAFAPEPSTEGTATQQRRQQRKKKWPLIAGAIACLALLACWLIFAVLRVETPNGTLIVELADKDAEARIKNGTLILSGPDGKVRYTLTPSGHDNTIDAGAYKIRVDGADGLTLDTSEFTLKKGDKVTVRVTVAPRAVVKAQPKKQDPPPLDPMGKNDPKKQDPVTESAPALELFNGKPGDVVEVEIAARVKMKFCWIPAGTATLGSPDTEMLRDADETEHEFKTQGFWLGKYPVTQGEWSALMDGHNPSYFVPTHEEVKKAGILDTSRFPVEQVSWDNCQAFVEKLNASVKIPTGLGTPSFCLPREDEWEYAARAGRGNKQAFYFGNELNSRQANCSGGYQAEKVGYKQRTTAVGSYETEAPHPWGLCDMAGNVFHWCYSKQNDPNDTRPVVRGGSWISDARFCRSAYRGRFLPGLRGANGGCRIAFCLDGQRPPNKSTVLAKNDPKEIPIVPVAPREPKPGDVAEVEIAKGVKMKFCWVPPGRATLGSPGTENERDAGNEAEHEFTSKGFWLGKYAVTQEEWQAVMGNNPSYFSKDGDGKSKVLSLATGRFPVERVSWVDCQDFLEKVNRTVKLPATMGKGKFALPHENEWEYACRGGRGNKQAYYFGNVLNGRQANCDGNNPFGTTTKGLYLARTSVVGSYENVAPHPWGLCDMHGNVWQWCENWYGNEQKYRVLRGGSWSFNCQDCRAAFRDGVTPGIRINIIGFRVVVSQD